jgi:hypothetical protein
VAVDLALHLHVIFLDDKKVTKFFFIMFKQKVAQIQRLLAEYFVI